LEQELKEWPFIAFPTWVYSHSKLDKIDEAKKGGNGGKICGRELWEKNIE